MRQRASSSSKIELPQQQHSAPRAELEGEQGSGGPPTDLLRGTLEIIAKPLQTLIPPWSWKAAAIAALFRAGAFFVSNLRSGKADAIRAMLLEAAYAVLTAGLIGAVSQRLRAAKPIWATAALVCIALPGVMLVVQFGIHHLAKTPHVGAGLVVSLGGCAISAGFTLFAMRHGSLLGGDDSTSLRHDFRTLPAITLDFILALPRAFLRTMSHN